MKPFDWVEKRVRVYATLNGSIAETKGTVTRMRPDGMFYVNLDGRRGEIVAHPKQCRLLVKKERRRVWVNGNSCLPGDPKQVATGSEYIDMHGVKSLKTDCVEFIEVKKK